MADWITNFYKLGLYTADQVKTFVACGWITVAQYQAITRQTYTSGQ